MAVIVEKRDIDSVVVHGSIAGLIAGLVLGVTTVIGSVLLTGSASWPFRFAASFIAGPDALDPAFPLGAALLLGSAHPFRAGGCFRGRVCRPACPDLPALGPSVVADRSMARSSASGSGRSTSSSPSRPSSRFSSDGSTSATQLWNGVLSYVFIYGPVLAVYVIAVRPGVIDDWRAVGPPAGTFASPGDEDRD